MQKRRAVLGDAWVDRTLKNRDSFNSEFQEMITRHVWGDIWTRPGIDPKTRRYMVMSIMIALHQWDEFKLHVRAALMHGFTKDDVKASSSRLPFIVARRQVIMRCAKRFSLLLKATVRLTSMSLVTSSMFCPKIVRPSRAALDRRSKSHLTTMQRQNLTAMDS